MDEYYQPQENTVPLQLTGTYQVKSMVSLNGDIDYPRIHVLVLTDKTKVKILLVNMIQIVPGKEGYDTL